MHEVGNRRPPKILVLILSARSAPWGLIEQFGQIGTFAKVDTENVQFVWYRGDEALPRDLALEVSGKLLDSWYKFIVLLNRWGLKGPRSFPGSKMLSSFLRRRSLSRLEDFGANHYQRKLLLPLPEFNSFIGLKTLLAFDHVLDAFDFDYLVRTNSSSYLDIQQLEKYLGDAPKQKYFSGFKGDFFGEEFSSGASYILSRDVVDQVTHNFSTYWQHYVVDDVAISRVIAENQLAVPTYFNRSTVVSINTFNHSLPLDRDVFHYRCKTKNVDETIQIMKQLQRFVESN